MRIFYFITLALLLISCTKNKQEQACALLDIYIPERIAIFIDKDSNNLLLNGVIDTSDIVIRDYNGSVQKFTLKRDSTLTKVRFVAFPLPVEKRGNSGGITITVGNQSSQITYRVAPRQGCNIYPSYEQFKLNGKDFTPVSMTDYDVFRIDGEIRKGVALFSAFYIVLQ
ncbi:hypothetical protein ABDK00_000670 [Niabella insulamsoli]|uniref:hypothetical protein n=1 Tax=Niabella insulamsoli TaxID=3144874 RepID=UPI0031FC2E22